MARRKQPLIAVDAITNASAAASGPVGPDDGDASIVDERLRLIFMCCHPALPPTASAALTLRLVAGLRLSEIARLFLVTEPTMSARLTRAKRKIVDSGIPFAVPSQGRLPDRLDTVLAVIYLVFTEGYAATSGPHAMRTGLSDEAIRLARTVEDLLPGEPAVVALLALMLLQHSRRDSRVDDSGRVVLLPLQDRRRWRHDEITEALGLLASTGGEEQRSSSAGRYRLQALIAAEHATATRAGDTDWSSIATHYAELERRWPSPIVRLNRAVAVAETDGPAAALGLLNGLHEALPGNHRVWTVEAELLTRLGRSAEALVAFDRAIELVANATERAHLVNRRAQVSGLVAAPESAS